jgi:hypothetical protein
LVVESCVGINAHIFGHQNSKALHDGGDDDDTRGRIVTASVESTRADAAGAKTAHDCRTNLHGEQSGRGERSAAETVRPTYRFDSHLLACWPCERAAADRRRPPFPSLRNGYGCCPINAYVGKEWLPVATRSRWRAHEDEPDTATKSGGWVSHNVLPLGCCSTTAAAATTTATTTTAAATATRAHGLPLRSQPHDRREKQPRRTGRSLDEPSTTSHCLCGGSCRGGHPPPSRGFAARRGPDVEGRRAP